MQHYRSSVAVCIGGFTVAVAEACLVVYLDPYERVIPWLALVIAVLYLLEWWAIRRINVQETPVTRPLEGVEVAATMDERTPKAEGDASVWEKLPVLAVPVSGRDVRGAVAAFAAKHGLRPYEAERGFALVDAQGHWYRASVDA